MDSDEIQDFSCTSVVNHLAAGLPNSLLKDAFGYVYKDTQASDAMNAWITWCTISDLAYNYAFSYVLLLTAG